MANKSVFKKSLVIGTILLFIGASVVPSICGNVEEKNERYRNTQPAIFNGGNSKGWNITEVVSTESTNWSWYPSLMVDTNSVVHVAWQDHTDYGGSDQDWDIFYKYKNNGGSWSTTEVVSTESTEDSYRPSLMVDTDSVVHVTWKDHTEYGGSGHDWDIFYKYKNNGGSWSTTEVVSTESKLLSESPSLMVDTNSVVHVAWEDKTNYGGVGNDVDIFYKYKNNGGSWSTTEVVTIESTEDSWYTSLMVDTDGVVHVVWNDDTDCNGSGSDTDIFYKYKSGVNEPPNKPTINGPTSGKAGTSYDYTFTSTDPDGDYLSYYIKWGDGDVTDWTAFQASGPPGYSDSHVWDEQGTYTIEAKAKDTSDVESEWADFLIVINKDEKPPNINITKPERGLYFFDKKIRDYLLRFRTPLIIGRITIEVNATDEDSGIEKVEFYINGKYMRNDTSFPYEFDWRWTRPRLFHLFIIKVIAYDNAGNNATKIMVVRKFL